jgi:hypothetical protein
VVRLTVTSLSCGHDAYGVLVYTQAKVGLADNPMAKTMKVISIEDQRWGRRDIKTLRFSTHPWADGRKAAGALMRGV